MLTTTNKKGIRDSLIEWSQRKNISDDVLNDFIELALSKANRALRIPPLETAATLAVDGDGYFELPENFLEVKELSVDRNGQHIVLERKAIHEVDYASTHSTGNPCIFGRYGNGMRIAPWDAESSVTRLYYYYVIPQMPSDQSENWFTLYAPEVLLYGALAELANYTRDQDGVALWNGKFNEAVDIIQKVEDRAAWSGGPIAVSLPGSH